MDPIVATILTIGSISSAAMALLVLVSTVLKKPKELIKKWVRNVAKEEFNEQLKPLDEKLNKLIEQTEKSEERERTKLGHSIMTIYDRSINRGYITLADKKDLIDLHQDYKNLHGNHHVDDYYNMMLDMNVK